MKNYSSNLFTRFILFNFWILVSLITVMSCTNSGIFRLEENSRGCTGALPVAALNERKVDVELANLFIQQSAGGNFNVKYMNTFKTLLNDEILGQWVREEMICQASMNFKTPNQKMWFLTMKEVAERGSSQEFLQWLRDNPMDSFVENSQSEESNLSIEIDSVNGHQILPHKALSASVKEIHRFGTLVVPGETIVKIETCNGIVKHNENATIIIKNSMRFCKQGVLE